VSDVIARPRDIRYRTVFLVQSSDHRPPAIRRFREEENSIGSCGLADVTCIRFTDLSLAIESRGLTKIRRGDDPFTADRAENERRAIRRSGGRVSRACGNII